MGKKVGGWKRFKSKVSGDRRRCGCNKADRHTSRAPSEQRPTDGPTDRPTDKAAYRVACMRLKIVENFKGWGGLKDEERVIVSSICKES